MFDVEEKSIPFTEEDIARGRAIFAALDKMEAEIQTVLERHKQALVEAGWKCASWQEIRMAPISTETFFEDIFSFVLFKDLDLDDMVQQGLLETKGEM